MKKYTVTYELEIEAGDMDEVEKLAEAEELKKKARLKTIKGKNECWERFYEAE
jgi:hypothetical protein